jgi:hypothetical protein
VVSREGFRKIVGEFGRDCVAQRDAGTAPRKVGAKRGHERFSRGLPLWPAPI